LNRLTNAIYQKENVATNSYNERLTYDLNGNITGLYRTGYQDGLELSNPIEIDNLEYGYASNSNQLQLVHDYSQSTNGFKDGNVNDTDFKYDGYGNLILDRNKGIDEITYNHLNLPTEIDFGDSGIIYYIYNALGVKVAKQVRAPEIQDQTDYLSGFQYKNGELQFFPTAEGYVNVTDGEEFNYVYNYTDHLGNIRLSYTFDGRENELKILEENHYYPFGLKHSNYNVDKVDFDKDETGFFVILKSVDRNKNQYKYNGKEFQDELGLNMYSMDMRQYDPAIGRWIVQDPITHHSTSPYTAFDNNPVIWADPSGADSQMPSWMEDIWNRSGSGETNWTNNGQGSFINVPQGEINGSGTAKYLSKDEDNYSRGVAITAPNGKKYYSVDKLKGYTYSDGKKRNGQQKKAGVWSYINNDGYWMWNHVKQQYVLNTSDRGGALNSFPSIGRAGTTYAGGDNPKNSITGDDDYSQPPQNIADYGGLVHDKEYDGLGLSGVEGTLSPQSTGANKNLIYFSNQVISMYNQKKIDPFTGAPVSEATMQAALNMSRAFTIIEQAKK
jgi:RHS repeat-associated protein